MDFVVGMKLHCPANPNFTVSEASNGRIAQIDDTHPEVLIYVTWEDAEPWDEYTAKELEQAISSGVFQVIE